MALKANAVTLTTDGSGDVTAYSKDVGGVVRAIKYSPGTIATGADLTITGETSAMPVLVKANAGTSVVWYFPVAAQNLNSDGSALLFYEKPRLLAERIKVVVAQGGATKTGIITFYTDE